MIIGFIIIYIVIFSIIKIVFYFYKENLKKEIEEEKNISKENANDYYKLKMDNIVKRFTVLGISIALLTYFINFSMPSIKNGFNKVPDIIGIIWFFVVVSYLLYTVNKIKIYENKIVNIYKK